MNELYGDAGHFIALLLPRDALHPFALGAASELRPEARIVTSELVLVEFLDHFSRSGSQARTEAIVAWHKLHSMPNVLVIPSSYDLLLRAAALFERSADKSWSFTDCASFVIMRERKIQDALTFDRHVEQAGFRALFREH